MADHDEHSVRSRPTQPQWAAVLDSMHIPKDAGEHRDALIRMMLHIPADWGRSVDCDAGWFGLLADLDADLAHLDPEYILQAVRQKYGGLRYYAEPSVPDAAIRDAFHERIDAAERESMSICERCAHPGILHERGDWLRTLCPECAQSLGYPPAQQA